LAHLTAPPLLLMVSRILKVFWSFWAFGRGPLDCHNWWQDPHLLLLWEHRLPSFGHPFLEYHFRQDLND
jgi:hypothetical protein